MVGVTLVSAIDEGPIDPHAPKDITVRIKEYRENKVNGNLVKQNRIKEFKCSKANLVKSADYFAAHWRYHQNKDNILFDGETHLSMEVWLASFHGTVPDRLRNISITEIWHVIDAGERYKFPLTKLLKDFFDAWYNINATNLTEELAGQLALPCFVFDNAKGFSKVTSWMIYNFPGHITENRPMKIKYEHIHLAPPEFVGPMNHARGRIKTVFHSRLWGPARRLHTEVHKCECRKATEFDYLDKLIVREVFPIDDYTGKNSINTLLNRLHGFSYVPAASSCHYCNPGWTDLVDTAVETVRGYSQGLCLDCMDRSRVRDDDAEYWRKCGAGDDGRWDGKCRVKHGEPTWYVSWLGRTEHRQKLLDSKQERMRARRVSF